jgi:hypothetical protein
MRTSYWKTLLTRSRWEWRMRAYHVNHEESLHRPSLISRGRPKTRENSKMSENDVIANQKRILQNQKSIIANQNTIKANQEIIKKNQASILKNQGTLDTIVKNQKKILAKIK